MRTWPSSQAFDEFDDGLRFRPALRWDETPAVGDSAVGRVLVLGDIHDNAKALAGALHRAAVLRCDALVQVGDFWLQDALWARRKPQTCSCDVDWAELLWLAVEAPIPVVVIDGNHEAWPCLTQFHQRPDVIEAQAAGRPLHLGGSLWWADRGSTWTWGGARCGALGGAVSPDKWMPALAGVRWADEEAPTVGDLQRLVANAAGGLDVLFCHDAPTGVRGLRSGLHWQVPVHIEAQAGKVRRLLRAAVDRTKPRLVFHGHWHQRNHEHLRGGATEVFGLADGAASWSNCAAVLDTAPLRAAYLHDGNL